MVPMSQEKFKISSGRSLRPLKRKSHHLNTSSEHTCVGSHTSSVFLAGSNSSQVVELHPEVLHSFLIVDSLGAFSPPSPCCHLRSGPPNSRMEWTGKAVAFRTLADQSKKEEETWQRENSNAIGNFYLPRQRL